MAEVNVSIRGRDDGLGQQLDSLRQKAAALGNDVSRINDINSQSPTQQRRSVEQTSADNLRTQREQIQAEYRDIRTGRSQEFNEARNKNRSGEMSDDEFTRYKQQFSQDNKELSAQENKELLDLEKSSAQSLRLILKELQDQRKLNQESAQRDTREFSENGFIGSLLSQNREFRSLQTGSTDQDEIGALQAQIDANNEQIRQFRRGGGGVGDNDDDDDRPGSRGGRGSIRQLVGVAGTAGTGDLVGTVMQTPSAMQGAGMGAGSVAMAGGIVGALYGLFQFMKQDEKLLEDTAPLAAMRGLGGRAGETNRAYREGIDSDGLLGNLGIERGEMAKSMLEKAKASGTTANLRERTMNDIQYQRGFGADVSQFSQFERFGGGESSKVGLDILNVLTEISESSLKSGDLVTLTEKLQSQSTIMGIQRQKRDIVDSDKALKILTAFETVGLSDKGDKGANFLAQTIQGLGEGGSDNVMMLKFEAAKRARPDLANNPAALRRLVKFNSDDPEYMNESFKMMGELSGGNEMALDDMLYTFFPEANEKDMEIYKKSIKGGKFSDVMKFKGSMGMRKTGLDEQAMQEDALSGTGAFTAAIGDFKNWIGELSTSFSGVLGMGGSAVNVAVVKDESKKPTSPNKNNNVPGNSTKPK